MTLSAAPFLPDGTVYGTLLNFRHEQALWAARATEPPYKAPPQAPVLFIKTANTFSAHECRHFAARGRAGGRGRGFGGPGHRQFRVFLGSSQRGWVTLSYQF
jgi:hypothetical protein